eukprot:SAG11_NODE_1057_length_6008_cov_3.405991_4_plen_37_part_00
MWKATQRHKPLPPFIKIITNVFADERSMHGARSDYR